MKLDLVEAAFGVEAPITVATAVACAGCNGAGTAPGTAPVTCDACGGAGQVQWVQRTSLGQVVTRPCVACQETGTTIPHPCASCAGDGRVRTRRSLTLKIPAGVDDGIRIRLAGQGEVGPGGGPAGDLYVEIHENPHDVYSRKGDDLRCRVTVPMTAAALGTRLTIKTLGSEEELEIRAGTQPGAILRLSGCGVPHLRSAGCGDLFVHLDIRTPTNLTTEQETVLRELASSRSETAAVTPASYAEDGSDVHLRVATPMILAALGTNLDVRTPKGDANLAIPAGTQPGASLQLRGYGRPISKSGDRGDLRVQLDVAVPTHLDTKSTRLMHELCALRDQEVAHLTRWREVALADPTP